MEERRSSSPPPRRKATRDFLLAFPERRQRFGRIGRAERLLTAAGVILLVLFTVGWSWSIARSRASGEAGGGYTPTAAMSAWGDRGARPAGASRPWSTIPPPAA